MKIDNWKDTENLVRNLYKEIINTLEFEFDMRDSNE